MVRRIPVMGVDLLSFICPPLGTFSALALLAVDGVQALLEAARGLIGRTLEGDEAERAGLVTMAMDDIDWDDEIRLLAEARAGFSPDALTGMEANLRFPGPETMETRIFGRRKLEPSRPRWVAASPGG